MVQFEGYERRIAKIESCMKEYGFSSLEEVKRIYRELRHFRGHHRPQCAAHRV